MELMIKKFCELTVEQLYEILKLRSAVFVIEQNCVYQDMDDKDLNAYHVFLKNEDGIQAYLRVLDRGVSYKEVSIGRVLTKRRGIGAGKQLMIAGIEVAQKYFRAKKIRISAQQYAKGFYETVGFRQVSEPYLEDGIPHIQMLFDINSIKKE